MLIIAQKEIYRNPKIAAARVQIFTHTKKLPTQKCEQSLSININSQKALNSVVGHEISHVLEGTELYTSLQSELKNYLGDAEYSKRLNAIKETYKNVYKGEDAETKFEQELTADLVGDLLFTDSDFVHRLSTENRNIFEKIFDEIKYLCRIATAGSKEAKQLEKIKKTFEDAYRESGQTQKNTATENGVRYSMDKSFGEQVDDVVNGNHNPRYDLYVSETPKIYTDLGFTDSPLLMRNGKINEILNAHPEMSLEIIKMIPDAVQKPILVLKSKTHPNESVVAITDIQTNKGEMIVPVWVNQDGNYLDLQLGEEIQDKTNFVASAYGREVKGLLEYANDNDGFLYQSEDIGKVRQLLARNGLQLPTPLKLSDSDIIVPQEAQTVNTNSMQKNRKNSLSSKNDDIAPSETASTAKTLACRAKSSRLLRKLFPKRKRLTKT